MNVDATTPHPRDVSAIISALRDRGSVHWPTTAIPEDFLAWRRDVRRAARAADLQISVRRLHKIVLIEHVDHVVPDDVLVATAQVIGDALSDTDTRITFEEALHQAKRRRLTIVHPSE